MIKNTALYPTTKCVRLLLTAIWWALVLWVVYVAPRIDWQFWVVLGIYTILLYSNAGPLGSDER